MRGAATSRNESNRLQFRQGKEAAAAARISFRVGGGDGPLLPHGPVLERAVEPDTDAVHTFFYILCAPKSVTVRVTPGEGCRSLGHLEPSSQFQRKNKGHTLAWRLKKKKRRRKERGALLLLRSIVVCSVA